MKNFLSPSFLIGLLLIGNVLNAQFSGGLGTQSDPWQVSTPEDLNEVRNYSGDWFIQTDDIDLYDATRTGQFADSTLSLGDYHNDTAYQKGDIMNIGSHHYVSLRNSNMNNFHTDSLNVYWFRCDNRGWQPFGFSGHYDGNDYSINGLFINRPEEGYVGLFGGVSGMGIVNNITLTNVNVIGGSLVGALAGSNDVVIQNCSAEGEVTCTFSSFRNNSGGLVGMSQNYIFNSSFTGTVTGHNTGRNIGGLVGANYDEAVVENCFADAAVSGTGNAIGGLVGYNAWESEVKKSFSTGTVKGTYSVGGLVGANHLGCLVENCYSHSNVSSYGIWDSEGLGGLVGANDASIIINSYSTGTVDGDSKFGGLVGIWQYPFIAQAVINSYWDVVASGQDSSFGGEGRTTVQMNYPYDQGTFVGWDFDSTWIADVTGTVNNGYPYLGITDVGMSIEDEDLVQQGFSVYPNPVNGHINVDIAGFNPGVAYELHLINVEGRRVYETKLYQEQTHLDVSNITAKGLYFIKLVNYQNQNVVVKKVILN